MGLSYSTANEEKKTIDYDEIPCELSNQVWEDVVNECNDDILLKTETEEETSKRDIVLRGVVEDFVNELIPAFDAQ